MKKFFTLIVAALLSTGAALAQTTEKGWSYALEAGVGTQLELGGRAQYGLNKYLAIDAPVVKYNLDYTDGTSHELKLMAGLRGYSPEFGPNLKGLLALDMGYGGTTAKHSDWTSCFALDLTVGLHINPNLYLGYGFGMLSKSGGKHKDHVLRVGWNF